MEDMAGAGAAAGGPGLAGGELAAATGTRSLLQGPAANSTLQMDITYDQHALGGYLDQQLTILWMLVCAFLVFFMQAGFALLEAGTVRCKNVRNIIMKNVIDAAVSTMSWWAVGFAFGYGRCGESGFIGGCCRRAASACPGTPWRSCAGAWGALGLGSM
jgi:Amt family ammonium transporter